MRTFICSYRSIYSIYRSNKQNFENATKNVKLYKYVKEYLLLEDDTILYDILKNYHGESNYYYQREHMFVHLEVDPKSF